METPALFHSVFSYACFNKGGFFNQVGMLFIECDLTFNKHHFSQIPQLK